MNLDATLSRINRRISEIAKTFGLNSREYMSFKFVIQSNIPDPLLRERNNEPVKLSRTNKALEGFYERVNDVEKILRYMSGRTAYQLARRYDTSGNYTKARFNTPSEQKRIRKLAVAEAVAQGFELEWYSAIDEIEDSQIQTIARTMFGNISQAGSSELEQERRYMEAVNFVQDALLKQGTAIKEGTYREPTEAQKAAFQQPTTLKDIMGGLYKK